MAKFFRFSLVLALALFCGMPGASAELLVVEGKVTIAAGTSGVPSAFVVEGTVFQMTGAALKEFAKEHGAGEFLVQVEGEFDLKSHQATAKKVALKEKLRS